MGNFIIDIGNSRIKAGFFDGEELQKTWNLPDLESLIEVYGELPCDGVLVSSVRWNGRELEEKLPFRFLFFDHDTRLPLKNAYKTPETLGLDRLAAAIGSQVFHTEGPTLVIDLGTCITFEFLDDAGVYRGGAISPGIKMRFEAMNRQTARLPLVTWPEEGVEILGDSTITCMQSGVYHGVHHEIAGMISRFFQQYPGLKVFICGGDAKYFESLTKDHIFVIPNLVLYGLNRILTYNVKKLHA